MRRSGRQQPCNLHCIPLLTVGTGAVKGLSFEVSHAAHSSRTVSRMVSLGKHRKDRISLVVNAHSVTGLLLLFETVLPWIVCTCASWLCKCDVTHTLEKETLSIHLSFKVWVSKFLLDRSIAFGTVGNLPLHISKLIVSGKHFRRVLLLCTRTSLHLAHHQVGLQSETGGFPHALCVVSGNLCLKKPNNRKWGKGKLRSLLIILRWPW